MRRSPLLALSMALLFSSIATGEKPEPESLFDGKSLDRWKVIGCEVEVVDGALMMKSGNGIVLADKKYGDFIFECDWKALDDEMWDSGIYFRCEMPPEGRPWPTEYQVNMRKKLEGSVPKREETITEGLMKPGKWNHFKLTVIGDVASLEFNGKKAWTIEGIERARGHLCLQAEVPGGGPFLFKNMTIVDLDEAKKEKESESESE